jgi:hypothetical protein
MKTIKLILVLVLSIFADEIPLNSPIVVKNKILLSWNKNHEADLMGYYVFTKIGPIEQQQTTTDSFIVINCTPIMLKEMARASFWVKAFDTENLVSDPSNIVTYVVSKDSVYLFGDLDGNRRVNAVDQGLFWHSQAFGSDSTMLNRYNCNLDLNQDGKIDWYDHLGVISNNGVDMQTWMK